MTGYTKQTNSFITNKLEIIKDRERIISWTTMEGEKYFRLSEELTALLNIDIEDRLLVGRGSGLGPAFIVKGTIYEEALKHDLMEFN